MDIKIENIFVRKQNKSCILIENHFSESNHLKNTTFRLPVKFLDSPKSVKLREMIKYCTNASHDIKKGHLNTLHCYKITHLKALC